MQFGPKNNGNQDPERPRGQPPFRIPNWVWPAVWLLILLWLELDLAERRLVLADVLLHHIQQRLRLLGAQINALKVLNGDGVWCTLS